MAAAAPAATGAALAWAPPAVDLTVVYSADLLFCTVTPYDHEFVAETQDSIGWTVDTAAGTAQAPLYQVEAVAWFSCRTEAAAGDRFFKQNGPLCSFLTQAKLETALNFMCKHELVRYAAYDMVLLCSLAS